MMLARAAPRRAPRGRDRPPRPVRRWSRSTIATSHSMPTVERADCANSMAMGAPVLSASADVGHHDTRIRRDGGGVVVSRGVGRSPRRLRTSRFSFRRDICKNGQSSSVPPDPLSGAQNPIELSAECAPHAHGCQFAYSQHFQENCGCQDPSQAPRQDPRARTTASSSPTRAPSATVASSRRSASTTPPRSPRSSRSTPSAPSTGSASARSRPSRSRRSSSSRATGASSRATRTPSRRCRSKEAKAAFVADEKKKPVLKPKAEKPAPQGSKRHRRRGRGRRGRDGRGVSLARIRARTPRQGDRRSP